LKMASGEFAGCGKIGVAAYTPKRLNLQKISRRLDLKKYGIIVRTAPLLSHCAAKTTELLLPDLEGVDTIEKQIYIYCRKGGADPRREKIVIYRFAVEEYQ